MERRKFVKNCCYSAIGLPLVASVLQSCGAIYYATIERKGNQIVVLKSEFIKTTKGKEFTRPFVLVKEEGGEFPICLYKDSSDNYVASLLKCTHRGCELNVGGGIYTCPCHGSEFSMSGVVLEGPADQDLKTFSTSQDTSKVYVQLS